MNKNLLVLAGFLAVCGFMTGCCKKQCEPRTTVRRDGKAKKNRSARHQNKRRAERDYLKK